MISSIFPREEEKLMNGISKLNDTIIKYCNVTHSQTFMENNQIGVEHLADSKHLNRNGLFLFLSNIRYHLFGQIYSGNNTRKRYQYQKIK